MQTKSTETLSLVSVIVVLLPGCRLAAFRTSEFYNIVSGRTEEK